MLRGFDSIYHVRFFTPTTMDGLCFGAADRTAPDATRTLEHLLDFEKVQVRVNRRFAYRWHMRKYLHIDLKEPGTEDMDERHWLDRMFGRKDEIVWLLRKPCVANGEGV